MAVAALARKLGEAANSMEWVTWTAEHEPSGLPEAEIRAYTERMYQLWPGIVRDHFVVAAYNTRVYDQMTPLVSMVMDLDSKIVKGAGAEYFEAARKTHDELSRRVSAMREQSLPTAQDSSFAKSHLHAYGGYRAAVHAAIRRL